MKNKIIILITFTCLSLNSKECKSEENNQRPAQGPPVRLLRVGQPLPQPGEVAGRAANPTPVDADEELDTAGAINAQLEVGNISPRQELRAQPAELERRRRSSTSSSENEFNLRTEADEQYDQNEEAFQDSNNSSCHSFTER